MAIACYAVRAFCDWRWSGNRLANSRQQFLVLVVWSIGCLFFLAHVYCAFAFVHDFSHRAAYQHTAEQTQQVIGLNWGGGLFVNYLFTVFWLVDVVACWTRNKKTVFSHPVYLWILHTVFVFLIFNATVVFGPPVWKPVALVVVVLMSALLIRRYLAERK